MGKNTKISWADHTFNAWWGCTKVSQGCAHCYAETWAKRFHGDVWGKRGRRRMMGESYWRQPLAWNRQAKEQGVRFRVFAGSMMDIFEDGHALVSTSNMVREARHRLLSLAQKTPYLDWLLLTKRPENIRKMVPQWWLDGELGSKWPVNVWVGTSVEDQHSADTRISHLLAVPAAVRFLSCEPLLGPVTLRNFAWPENKPAWHKDAGAPMIDWVIVGGESGEGARPMNVDWARSLLAECRANGVAFWMKQLGGVREKRVELADFPEDLRFQELPPIPIPGQLEEIAKNAPPLVQGDLL